MKRYIILPKHILLFEKVGENIKLARKRRKLTTIQVAERADIVRTTLYQIEKGNPSVAIGAYFNVLRVLGLQDDFLKLAADDELGRKLQDLELLNIQDKEEKKIKMTYLMVNKQENVKISKSTNPSKRERTLQAEDPFMKLYATIEQNIEKELHDKYKHKKIRGEWFDLSIVDIMEILTLYSFKEIK
jgi:transcriptional regulator with XRE-family HTH domain